jgi:DNA ligase-associated metallophosphoesterase
MAARIVLGGEAFVADRRGALLHEATGTLVVADLHFEKGSGFARRFQHLPPYDTLETAGRLLEVAAQWRPRRIVALGDSFHDPFAGERLTPPAIEAIRALADGRELIWIHGNHDPALPAMLPGERAEEIAIGGVDLRHAPRPNPIRPEIAGHFHPVALVASDRGRVRRACFVEDGRRLILPAFGAYAGGLNLLDPVVRTLFLADMRVLVCGERRLYPVPLARLAPDR